MTTMTLADALIFLGICGLVIAAILRFVPAKINSSTDNKFVGLEAYIIQIKAIKELMVNNQEYIKDIISRMEKTNNSTIKRIDDNIERIFQIIEKHR